ncbi:helix-turn-helix domain-containing protein [Burkholderia sp. Bp8963]|nr:helix-turn-helix domain-containing protein [Burkholderia sp. Bp8963]RQS69494.1 helix-turn-helix domain-containing protein [Burkholderia sp. Bp8963]
MDVEDQRLVVIFLSTGFSLAQAARLGEAFNLANRLQALGAAYQLEFVSATGGLLQSSSGVKIATGALDDTHGQRAHAFFHLHGDRAVVTWSDALQRRLTDIRANARWIGDAMKLPEIVASNPAGGSTSLVSAPAASAQAGDCDDVFSVALDMFRSDLGDDVTQDIARNISRPVDPHQAQSMWAIRELSASPPIRASVQQLRAQSANRISIAGTAQSVAMSERNFLRRFKTEIGMTPTEFVLSVRLERACHMLVHTSLPADKVARRTGLGSGERLAKLFRQRLSMSPTEYRAAERDRISKADSEPADMPAASWPYGVASGGR